MSYAEGRVIHDADSHIMEGLDWLHRHADQRTKGLLPDLEKVLGAGGAGASKAVAKGEQRIGDAAKVAELEKDVIASAKGWMALGAMDPTERTRALDLLGFRTQLVFSTFSLGLFAFADDLDLVYGGTSAHNRMMASFCEGDDRLSPVAFLPLNDAERSREALAEAIDLGCRALWVACRPTAGRSPSHVDNEPIWAAIAEAGVPIVMHIGCGRAGVSSAWHRNGRPRPTDLHGGGESIRAKDLPAVAHQAEIYLSTMILDGVLDRHPDLRVGVMELGAAWVPSLMARLDYTAKSFSKTEPLLGELELKPSEYLSRQVRVTPFPGEDVAGLVEMTSPELYLFSSDYPHPEGTRDPLGRFEASFDDHGTPDDVRDRFYSTNYRELLGV
ncbi:MAG: amidohydrolase family protein [Actinomycetota bacterium]|nr:amidohydrolase family protein [Actinomycetota bacterium]